MLFPGDEEGQLSSIARVTPTLPFRDQLGCVTRCSWCDEFETPIGLQRVRLGASNSALAIVEALAREGKLTPRSKTGRGFSATRSPSCRRSRPRHGENAIAQARACSPCPPSMVRQASASKTWRRLKGTNQLLKVIADVSFENGMVIEVPTNHAA
jgi:hypothetical protein